VLLTSAAVLAVGCNVGPNYEPPRIEVLPQYAAATTGPASSGNHGRAGSTTTNQPPVADWWRTFRDPQLDVLVGRALAENLDLQRATSRVRQARAERAALAGGLFPRLDANGTYSHARQSANGVTSAFSGGGAPSTAAPGAGGTAAVPGADISEFDLYQGSFDASWEIDLFGAVRRSVESADATLQAAVEDRRDVLVSLLGEVARNYLDLRAAQRRLDIARSNLASQRRSREITVERYRQGLTSHIDVDRADAEVASTEARVPTLETTIGQTIHQLSVLLGQRPTELTSELSAHAPLPPIPDAVPIGLPADLIFRRPDIRRAERQLAAATARIGLAQAQLYPSISLTGSIGYQSLQPGTLLDYHSRFYSFGPTVSIPIFQGGRLTAEVHLEEARSQEAALAFKQAVLNALKDVENALIAYAKSQQRVEFLTRAVKGNQSAVDILTDQYKQGIADFLTVLDAQRSLLASQDDLAVAESEVDTNLVSLYKALGGGWQGPQDAPSAPPSEPPVTSPSAR
jgi:NodT family efflux transporter outer membrane factor (OMF) lipoprotein